MVITDAIVFELCVLAAGGAGGIFRRAEYPHRTGGSAPVGNFSLIDIAERQVGYIGRLIAELNQGRCREISVTQAAMDEYEVKRIAAAKGTIFGSGCKSWCLDAEGVPASWPWSYDAFAQAMATPDLSAYALAE